MRPFLGPVLGATALLLAGCATTPPTSPPIAASSPFDQLPGWPQDHVAEAMPALLRGCARLALTPIDQKLGGSGPGAQAGDWRAACAAARALPPNNEAAARAFLQARFDPVPLTDASHPDGLFTGYYEPEVEGARERSRLYHVALLARPDDLIEQTGPDGSHRTGRVLNGQFVPYYTRAEIDHGALRRQRLDLLYLKSPIDLLFLQIQGAGRIKLPNGLIVRVGYAGNNGQPYVPVGRVLSQAGDIPPDQVSAQTIRAWLQAHPRDVAAVLEQNPRYTFFRELPNLPPDQGPPGTLGVQLTPLRSIAVDPAYIPLGAPVWIDTTNVDGERFQRLMLAQDSGIAITGAVHLDIFYGWGDAAEDQAGRMHAPGRAWVLLPKAAPNT